VANEERIKAELAAQSPAQEVMAQANAQATKFIEEARAAAPDCTTKRSRRHRGRGRGPDQRHATPHRDQRAHALRAQTGDRPVVVDTTAAVTGKILTPEDQRRLVGGDRGAGRGVA